MFKCWIADWFALIHYKFVKILLIFLQQFEILFSLWFGSTLYQEKENISPQLSFQISSDLQIWIIQHQLPVNNPSSTYMLNMRTSHHRLAVRPPLQSILCQVSITLIFPNLTYFSYLLLLSLSCFFLGKEFNCPCSWCRGRFGTSVFYSWMGLCTLKSLC